MTAFLIVMWVLFFIATMTSIDDIRDSINVDTRFWSIFFALIQMIVMLGILGIMGYIIYYRLMP